MKTISDYTIYCTEEQCEKAIKLGAPIEILPNYTEYGMFPFVKCADGNERPCILPTAEQMLGWLRSMGFKFLLSDEPDIDGCHWFVGYGTDTESVSFGQEKDNKELAAISSALEYLINNKK